MAVYGPWLATVFSGYLTGKTVKALLVTNAFTQDVDHQFRSSITNEVTATGYTAGGVTVTGVTVAYDATLDRLKITAADVNFGTLTIPALGGVVFYVSTGSAAADPLIAADIFASPVEVTSTNLTYRPNAAGVVVGTL